MTAVNPPLHDPCSKPIFMPPGSPKTYFVFSHNFMYNMFFKLFDSQDFTFNLIFVKSCPTVASCFYGQNKSKSLQICFMPYPTTIL